MTMKRKSAIEIFRIHKRVRDAPIGDVPPPNPLDSPGPPVPPGPTNEAESSDARIRREAVEDYKGSSEFRDMVDEAGAQSFVEGLYAYRHWINYHSPHLDLKGYTFSIVLFNFRFLPYNYLLMVGRRRRGERQMRKLKRQRRLKRNSLLMVKRRMGILPLKENKK